ncbi:reduction of Rh1 isoform X1 [Colletes latitarsis]|uniref:reduction of Rh1 isoform X1 n=2 Tax=Colletes latitarsis TaxID=2605962 RepID=UPI00403544A7
MSRWLTQLSNTNLKKAMSSENPGRPMKFPYTLSAKIAQFPYKYYFTHKSSWVFKFWLISVVLTAPLFYKIQKLSYSPENVKKWDEIHRKEFLGEVGHH